MTDVERWRKNRDDLHPGWEERTKLLASFIKPGTSVLDVGAGSMTLKKYLPKGCFYYPVDLSAEDPQARVDFNKGLLPTLPLFDIAVLSGVLEYVVDVEGALYAVGSWTREALISYAPVIPDQDRAAHGWLSHLDRDALEAAMGCAAWDWEPIGEWRGQLLYRLEWTHV